MTFEDLPPMSDDEREALVFLGKGRKLRGLSQAQFRRIERRLAFPKRSHRSRRWWPVLAAIVVVVLAGAALARVMDTSRLPFIGRLFPFHAPDPMRATARSQRPSAVLPWQGRDPSDASPKSTLPAKDPSTEAPSPTAAPPAAAERGPRTARPGKRQAAQPSDSPPITSVRATRPGTEEVRRLSLAPPPGHAPSAKTSAAIRGAITSPRVPERGGPEGAPMPTRPAPPRQDAVEDPISAESRSFSAALAEWHRDHDAQAALAALDEHERRFRYGQIHLEAKLLRAEILLHTGRETETLRLLDSVSLSGLPRGRELQTVRGELRVKYGRCREGRSDLEHVLAKTRTDRLGLRAARAMSLCP